MKMTKHHLIIVWIFILVFVLGYTSQNEASETHDNIPATSENIRIAEISLSGMFCKACVRNAEIAFRGMDGVIDATVDIETKKGMVIYKPMTISKKQLIQNPVIQAYDGKILSDREYNPSGNE